MEVPTGLMGRRLTVHPVFAGFLTGVSEGPWVPAAGGVQIVGAHGAAVWLVGTSGDYSENVEKSAVETYQGGAFRFIDNQ